MVGIRLDSLKRFVKANRKLLSVWILIILFTVCGLTLNLDAKAVALGILVFGYATHAFAGLLLLVAAIPVVGSSIVAVITLPFFLVINGLAYIITLIALRKGRATSVINSRILVSALLVGIIIGYVMGRFL